MKPELVQFNVRIPAGLARLCKIVAAETGTSVQEISADAFAVYYGEADEKAKERHVDAIRIASDVRGRDRGRANLGNNRLQGFDPLPKRLHVRHGMSHPPDCSLPSR